jgi:TetR/AcrR family transcriptional regulator, repressor of fatR-cypB operon
LIPSSPPKREAVLDEALGLFAERTVAGARMPELAARAGVGAGTIYRYFESKEALANAVYRRGKERLRDVLAGAKRASSREEFVAIWAGLWRFAVEDRDALIFVEAQQHAAYLDQESRALDDEVRALAVDSIERGQARGELRDGDPTRMVAVIFGAFVAIVQAAQRLELDDRDAPETMEMLWAALAAPTSTEGATP